MSLIMGSIIKYIKKNINPVCSKVEYEGNNVKALESVWDRS